MKWPIVFLMLIALPSFAKTTKHVSEAHTGTLVLLVTPDVSAVYTAAIYLDDSTVAIVDEGLSLKDCSSSACFEFDSLVSSMKTDCYLRPVLALRAVRSDVCFEEKSIDYYTGQISKHHQVDSEVGISLASGETMWFVPIMETADQFGKMMWSNHLSVAGEGPHSPSEWEQAISNLLSQRQADADKAAYRARVASNLAEIAAEEATRKERDCLTNLKVGDSISSVNICGAPDHTNSDLYSDQMVYPGGIIVYVSKVTNAVEDVQWTQ